MYLHTKELEYIFIEFSKFSEWDIYSTLFILSHLRNVDAEPIIYIYMNYIYVNYNSKSF